MAPDSATSEPAASASSLYVVGLGASAGGIAALREFFAHAVDTHVAYCVVLHLSPDHASELAQVLQHGTALAVEQVRGPVEVQAGRVYVIPPNCRLTLEEDTLRIDAATAEERRAAVDTFFASLADARGTRCAAAVLSGTGRDGSSGLKRVKEHGGLTLAQTPHSAEYAQMPEHAIATGLVDVVAAPGDMPRFISRYQQRLDTVDLHEGVAAEEDAAAIRDVLNVLRSRTGHDFSSYKTPTLLRRIRRRALLREAESLLDYAAVMRSTPGEAPALMNELLISVTRFFRDPEAYATLAQIAIPQLFRDKRPQDHVRVWVSACATGEEAYSLAMLLAEQAALSEKAPRVQVFATDLDAAAVATARIGLYSEAEVAAVGDERLRRFFFAEPGGFRVRRELREMILFAPHNVIRDPPFSHMDLIACRNLLIYLNRSAQEQVLATFHFALRPGGYLWVGASESADVKESLFVLLDKGAHLYEARTATTRLAAAYRDPMARSAPPQPEDWFSGVPVGLLHQRLLEAYSPPSVVIGDDFRVVHMSERAGRYMAVTGGEPSRNLLTLLRPELRGDVRAAAQQAMRSRAPAEVRDLTVEIDGRTTRLAIVVRPVLRQGEPPRGLFLVLFEEDGREIATPPAVSLPTRPDSSAGLEDELAHVRAELRSTVEQYETQQEEAKAANEELQAMNEELRSAAEELESGKEELQSVNEELITVNEELRVKVNELAQTNADFQNLIAATEIGTIFLDTDLRIKFSTPSARAVFNLQDSDIGRPLSDITNQLLSDTLHEDVRTVVANLAVIDRQIAARDGRWYLVRVRPYRTGELSVSGVVITFHDISQQHAAETQAREGEERLRLLIDSAVDYAILTMTPDGLVDFWNSGAQRMFGYAAEEILGRDVALIFTPEDRAARVPEEERARAARHGRAPDQRFHLRKDGSRFFCAGVVTPLGQERGFAKIARDVAGPRDPSESQTLRRVREAAERFEVHSRDSAIAHAEAVRRIVGAQETERARVARDLHDSLGQLLTALRLTIERFRALPLEGARREAEIERGLEIATALDRELDFLVWELRPSVIEELGLAAALPRFVREWSQHYNVPAEYRSTFEPGQLSADAEVAFYRVAQEALNNVAKHARANRVDVILEGRQGLVTLVVEDNGVGFDAANPELTSGRFGVTGMRERAELVGGSLEIESTPGDGTSIFLRCPITMAGR
jgi:two-component system, chemotaxis family, CheB/CheR fusion protein